MAFLSSKAEAAESVMSSLVVPMVAGGVATAVGDLAVHPFDTIKTMTQSSSTGEASTFMGASRQILRETGPLGFYAGVGPFVLLDSLSGCIKFGVYELCKQFSLAHVPEEHRELSNFVSAAVAFIACSVVLVPGELLKTKLQAKMYPGVRACIAGVWKEGGVRGMFQGYKEILVRDVPYTMLELGLYDSVKGFLERVSKKSNGKDDHAMRNEIIAAALVGGFVGFVTNPLDVIKTRMMIASASNPPKLLALTKSIWKEGGIRSFLGGGTARVAWLMPFTAVYLPAYDFVKRELLLLQQAAAEAKAALSAAKPI